MARVVLLHGFTQTGASWGATATRLRAAGHEVHAPDLPGHAGTPACTMEEAATTIADALGDAVYVGYSMGGRLALHVALTRPASVRGLVLLGATAGIDDARERNARRHADERLARRVEHLGVARFVDEWLSQPMFEDVPRDAESAAARLRNAPDGLAAALRLAGTGAQEPLWHRLGEIGAAAIPVLVLAGELDGKFKVLARRLVDAIGPTAELGWVAGAGHAAHLEQPDAFVSLVEDFLDAHG